MRILGNHPTKRFSDLPDEVQVKDRISLDILKGIIIPFMFISYNQNTNKHYNDLAINFLKKLKELLISYKRDIHIYDLDTKSILQTEDDIKLILKKY